MNEQVLVSVVSALVSLSSAVLAGLSLLYNRSQDKANNHRNRRLTTLSFYQIWMSGDMYHARVLAGAYCLAREGQSDLVFSEIQLEDPESSECIGRVMHFIAEITVANRADISDRDLSNDLFGPTFREWQDHLTIFAFPDTPFHNEFQVLIKEAARL